MKNYSLYSIVLAFLRSCVLAFLCSCVLVCYLLFGIWNLFVVWNFKYILFLFSNSKFYIRGRFFVKIAPLPVRQENIYYPIACHLQQIFGL